MSCVGGTTTLNHNIKPATQCTQGTLAILQYLQYCHFWQGTFHLAGNLPKQSNPPNLIHIYPCAGRDRAPGRILGARLSLQYCNDTAAGYCSSVPAYVPAYPVQPFTTHSWLTPNVLGIQLNGASSGRGYHSPHHPEALMIL